MLSTGGVLYFISVDGECGTAYLTRLTPSGGFTFFNTPNGLGIDSCNEIGNFVLGADGRIWFPSFFNSFGQGGPLVGSLDSVSLTGQSGPSVAFNNWFGAVVTTGPAANLYLTIQYGGNPPSPSLTDSYVYVISTSAVILHKFPLPNGSHPIGIADGSDHNLWIAESGSNKIARMTPAGVVTQFSLPTANAGPNEITAAADGALWFTENKANKIGKITTTGHITEYAIPTANSDARGIVPCTTSCPPHGGVWFAEWKGNKLGKFASPL